MAAAPRLRVALVLDPDAGDRIVGLARGGAVWAVESLVNLPAIRRCWESPDLPSDPAEGVTSFVVDPEEAPEDACERLAGDLEDHHGEFAHDPPWSEIEVFGARLTPSVERAFQEIGATDFRVTTSGFVCTRSRP